MYFMPIISNSLNIIITYSDHFRTFKKISRALADRIKRVRIRRNLFNKNKSNIQGLVLIVSNDLIKQGKSY
jgi:hypothetical protein